jgi:hypothetical protein
MIDDYTKNRVHFRFLSLVCYIVLQNPATTKTLHKNVIPIYNYGLQNRWKLVSFWQNRSGSALKTEANYCSNGFQSVPPVYQPVFVGFENRYCSGFSILVYDSHSHLCLLVNKF